VEATLKFGGAKPVSVIPCDHSGVPMAGKSVPIKEDGSFTIDVWKSTTNRNHGFTFINVRNFRVANVNIVMNDAACSIKNRRVSSLDVV